MMNNRGRLLGAGLVALMHSGWEVASLAGWLNPFLFPPVHAILVGLAESLLDGRLVAAVTASLGRGGAGYLIAALAGIGGGTLGRYRAVGGRGALRAAGGRLRARGPGGHRAGHTRRLSSRRGPGHRAHRRSRAAAALAR